MTATTAADALPPASPPPGCWSPLLWDLARRCFLDHHPGLDGRCVLCKPAGPAPCRPRRTAAVALNLASHPAGRAILARDTTTPEHTTGHQPALTSTSGPDRPPEPSDMDQSTVLVAPGGTGHHR